MAHHSCKADVLWNKFPLTEQTGAIDDAHRTVTNVIEEPKREEGKKIVAELAKLKYELQHDRKLMYIPPPLLIAINVNEIDPSSMMVNQILRPTIENSNN